MFRAAMCLFAAIMAVTLTNQFQTPASAMGAGTTTGSTVALEQSGMAWVPSYVSVESGIWEGGARYIRSTMIWYSEPWFPENSTYENDLWLNNSPDSALGPGTYLSQAETFPAIPATIQWDSNLPAPYLDSRLLDSRSTELAYTIGSGDAHNIQAGVEYYTLLVMEAGEADFDDARLYAQLGEQAPAGCTDTLCSYFKDSYTIFGVGEVQLPGFAEYAPSGQSPVESATDNPSDTAIAASGMPVADAPAIQRSTRTRTRRR